MEDFWEEMGLDDDATQLLCKCCPSLIGCCCGLKWYTVCQYIHESFGAKAVEKAKKAYCVSRGMSYPMKNEYAWKLNRKYRG